MNDFLEPHPQFGNCPLAHICPPTREQKGVGVRSSSGYIHTRRGGSSYRRGFHRLDNAVGDNPTARRVCHCGDGGSPNLRSRDLEIEVIFLLVAVWIMVAAATITVLLGWASELLTRRNNRR